MPITTVTSREFNQDVGRAKKAAAKGPVVITDRGRPAHVLLTIDNYRRIIGSSESIADMLADPKAAAVPFDAPRLDRLHRAPDFS